MLQFGGDCMEILNDIKKYLTGNFKDDNFFQMYSFTTENINGYMPKFNLKGKTLLTVGSSSDQAINASLAGCNEITVCDICPLTKYFYYLKLSSLIVLDREEFLNFLCKTKYKNGIEYNPYFLTKKTFLIIKSALKKLDYESYYVWEYLFENYSRYEIEKLFRKDVNSLESIIYCNRYLKNDYNYNHTKEIVMNTLIKFVNRDISSAKFDKSFDNIWLSNVAQYLNSSKILSMIENSNNHLNSEGKILLCYFWNTSMTIKGFPIEVFSKIESQKNKIPGILKKDDKNSILVYEKTKSLILK